MDRELFALSMPPKISAFGSGMAKVTDPTKRTGVQLNVREFGNVVATSYAAFQPRDCSTPRKSGSAFVIQSILVCTSQEFPCSR